jgi:hypothetical protein
MTNGAGFAGEIKPKHIDHIETNVQKPSEQNIFQLEDVYLHVDEQTSEINTLQDYLQMKEKICDMDYMTNMATGIVVGSIFIPIFGKVAAKSAETGNTKPPVQKTEPAGSQSGEKNEAKAVRREDSHSSVTEEQDSMPVLEQSLDDNEKSLRHIHQALVDGPSSRKYAGMGDPAKDAYASTHVQGIAGKGLSGIKGIKKKKGDSVKRVNAADTSADKQYPNYS